VFLSLRSNCFSGIEDPSITTMRLKIETSPPLPTIKAWFSFHHGLFGLRIISDLRKRLIAELQLPTQINLRLNGYDLLDSNRIGELLSQDDLVTYGPV
jgi:hypothetical protein